MRILHEILVGLVAAFSTSALVLGAISLALTEGMVLPAGAAPVTEIPQAESIETIFPGFVTPTSKPSKTPRLVTATAAVVKTTCSPALGWTKYIVRAGDTLQNLAVRYGVTELEILQANCWDSPFPLPVGTQMLLLLPTATPSPLIPTSTITATRTVTSSRTPTSCVPRRSWSTYIVQPGDNLYQIARLFGTTVPELVTANCLVSQYVLLSAGKTLYVPPGSPRYTATNPPPPPNPTNPPANTVTHTPTVRVNPSSTFTPTATSTSTATATGTATNTSTATKTSTSTGTNTATATSTPTATYTPTTAGQ